MEKFFDYISDGAVQCKIIRKENGKVDLQAIYANKKLEAITNVPNDVILKRTMNWCLIGQKYFVKPQ